MSNNVQKGSLRDRQVLGLVELHGALTCEQVYLLLFADQKSGLRICQRRLQKLYEARRVKRMRTEDYFPYVYYHAKPGLVEHTLAVNWVYVWAYRRLLQGEELIGWKREDNYEILRADAFFVRRHKGFKTFRPYFVEVDLGSAPFNKVELYNRVYAGELYRSRWWVEQTAAFPVVLVVTVRPEEVQREIERENRHGLRFEVRELEGLIVDAKRG